MGALGRFPPYSSELCCGPSGLKSRTGIRCLTFGMAVGESLKECYSACVGLTDAFAAGESRGGGVIYSVDNFGCCSPSRVTTEFRSVVPTTWRVDLGEGQLSS